MSEQQIAVDRQIVVGQQRQLTVVSDAILAFNANPRTIQRYIKEYGIEAIEYALELKNEGLDFKIGKFMSIIKLGFTPEEVVTFYNTYHSFREGWIGKNSKEDASLMMIAKMAGQFTDFREMPVEDQVDVLKKVQEIFHKINRLALEKAISRAQELSISDVDNFLKIMEDYHDGSLWQKWGFDEDATGVQYEDQ